MKSWSIRRLENEHPCVPVVVLQQMLGTHAMTPSQPRAKPRVSKIELERRSASIRRYEEEHGVSLTEGYINER